MELKDFFAFVPQELLQKSGKVAYSGHAAFSGKKPVYMLGLNPGGSPEKQISETIEWDMEQSLKRIDREWSAYIDESWGGARPGYWGLQPRIKHLCNQLNLDPRETPSSNLVFVRSQREGGLSIPLENLVSMCWPFHQAVLQNLNIQLVICFGKTAGNIVRKKLEAHRQVANFTEANHRRWSSCVHEAPGGLLVATLTHPSVAAWNVPATDPTPILKPLLVQRLTEGLFLRGGRSAASR